MNPNGCGWNHLRLAATRGPSWWNTWWSTGLDNIMEKLRRSLPASAYSSTSWPGSLQTIIRAMMIPDLFESIPNTDGLLTCMGVDIVLESPQAGYFSGICRTRGQQAQNFLEMLENQQVPVIKTLLQDSTSLMKTLNSETRQIAYAVSSRRSELRYENLLDFVLWQHADCERLQKGGEFQSITRNRRRLKLCWQTADSVALSVPLCYGPDNITLFAQYWPNTINSIRPVGPTFEAVLVRILFANLYWANTDLRY